MLPGAENETLRLKSQDSQLDKVSTVTWSRRVLNASRALMRYATRRYRVTVTDPVQVGHVKTTTAL